VNGSIRTGEGVVIESDVESVNGPVSLGAETRVAGEVATINGPIELVHGSVGRDKTPMIPEPPELPESRLYTFIDDPHEFTLYFLEGQRLIQDVALLHPIRRTGFAYFRDVVLSIQPMIALLKPGSSSASTSTPPSLTSGSRSRSAITGPRAACELPEEFQEFPEAMSGLVRVHKLFPRNHPPYESVLKVEGLPLKEIVQDQLEAS
jgi:hypothetical protein